MKLKKGKKNLRCLLAGYEVNVSVIARDLEGNWDPSPALLVLLSWLFISARSKASERQEVRLSRKYSSEMASLRKLGIDQVKLEGKRVLMRIDLNVQVRTIPTFLSLSA